jgi:hypothetical protein
MCEDPAVKDVNKNSLGSSSYSEISTADMAGSGVKVNAAELIADLTLGAALAWQVWKHQAQSKQQH